MFIFVKQELLSLMCLCLRIILREPLEVLDLFDSKHNGMLGKSSNYQMVAQLVESRFLFRWQNMIITINEVWTRLQVDLGKKAYQKFSCARIELLLRDLQQITAGKMSLLCKRVA